MAFKSVFTVSECQYISLIYYVCDLLRRLLTENCFKSPKYNLCLAGFQSPNFELQIVQEVKKGHNIELM